GVAIYIGPEPCVGVREGGDEASVGEGIGQPLSRESLLDPGADAAPVRPPDDKRRRRQLVRVKSKTPPRDNQGGVSAIVRLQQPAGKPGLQGMERIARDRARGGVPYGIDVAPASGRRRA